MEAWRNTKTEKVLRGIFGKEFFSEIEELSAKQQAKVVQNTLNNIDCQHLHDNSCLMHNLICQEKFVGMALKLYFVVHFLPLIIFKRKRLLKAPLKELFKALKGMLRSTLSMTAFSFIGRYYMCNIKKILGEQTPWNIFLLNSTCAMSIFIENNSRWAEFSMNIFPRLLESWPVYLRKQKLFPRGAMAYYLDVRTLLLTLASPTLNRFRAYFQNLFLTGKPIQLTLLERCYQTHLEVIV